MAVPSVEEIRQAWQRGRERGWQVPIYANAHGVRVRPGDGIPVEGAPRPPGEPSKEAWSRAAAKLESLTHG